VVTRKEFDMRSSSSGPGTPPPRGVPPSSPPGRASLVTGLAGADVPSDSTLPGVIVDVSEATFDADVIERSFEVPVVIDLWATWCGPCKQLSPILEDLAREGAGQWVLCKLDVDKAPNLAAQFQAQSIPMVVAIYQGRAVHSFMGAQPKAQVERWIQTIFQALRLPFHAPEREPEPPADPKAAEAFWRQRLAKKGDDKARLGLGRLLIARGELAEAEQLLNAIAPGGPEYGAAAATLALNELVSEVGAAGGDAAVRAQLAGAPDDPVLRYLVAIADGTAGHFVKALDVLVALVGATKEPIRGRAKKAASMLFEAAGRGDEAIEALRKRLARLLF